MPQRVLTLVAAALLAAALGPILAAEAPTERVRLVLTDGAFHDVRGPVERRDGLVLFRDDQGRLASIPEDRVREVRPIPAAPSRVEPAPVPAPAPPAAAAPSPAARFTNQDLPFVESAEEAAAPEEPEAPEPAEPAADLPPPAEDAPAEDAPAEDAPAEDAPVEGEPLAAGEGVAEPERSILPPPPSEVGGRPEAWWREEIARRRGEIRALERQENTTYRLWVCAMEEIPLTDGECRPQMRLPPVNKIPRTPTQKSLTAQLDRIRKDLEAQRAGLASFIDGAIAAGVPTSWLLDGAEESAPEG